MEERLLPRPSGTESAFVKGFMDKSAASSPTVTWLANVFRTRVLPGLILAPLGLWIVYVGGWLYFAFCALILGVGVFEYVRLVAHLDWQVPLPLALLFVFLQLLGAQLAAPAITAPALLAGLFVALLYALYLYEKKPQWPALASGLATIGAIMLFGWVGGHLLRLRLLPEAGAQWTLLAVLSVWSADAGAFVAGSWFGRRRLAPRISPGKTVEGYLGGVVAGTLGAALVALLFSLPLPAALLIGFLVALLAPVGDLSFSLIKREAGVKESGRLFGGHGGMLDRLDSLIWAVAIAYYIVLVI